MKWEFVLSRAFDRNWKCMGLTEEDLRRFQNMLLANPDIGDVIPHLKGIRKVRFGLRTHGKSGGIRVIYVNITVKRHIHLLTAYPKNVQDDLSPEQENMLLTLLNEIKEE